MRASICVGDYAATPYCISGLDIAVSCMEELCYCLRENAFLLDLSLLNDSLVSWIEESCGVKELARELYPLVHKQGSLSAFVVMILEYVGLYEPAVIREVEQVLRQGAGLSGIEKRKKQIDYLVGKKKYVAALRGYDALLEQWKDLEEEGRELPAGQVRGAILYNKGVVFARMMLYDQAADCFRKAQKASEDASYSQAYLAARRLELSENAYIDFAAERPENYAQSLELEKQLTALEEEWHKQPEYQRVQNRIALREKDRQQYYEESERMLRAFRESYRNSIKE